MVEPSISVALYMPVIFWFVVFTIPTLLVSLMFGRVLLNGLLRF
jgi:hypothetical protein